MRTLACILALSLVSVTHAGSSVPFHATIDTQVEIVGGPFPIDLEITGTGQATHLGRIDISGPSQVIPLSPTSGVQTGSSSLVGADGSTLEIEFSGTVVFTGGPNDPVTFQGTWHVTSGDGRFEGASGGGPYSGRAANGTGLLLLDGSIGRPGKN